MNHSPQNQESAHHVAVFQETTIRSTWHNEAWWFALHDVILVLTDSADVKQYIKKMRSRDPALDANWGTTCTPLVMLAAEGKMRETNCANTEGLFRIIQFIPSPKAEPFKRWLAQVGYERVKEIENPEFRPPRNLHQNAIIFGRNRLDPLTVIPAKAGIQTSCASSNIQKHWIPAFAGMTNVVCLHWSDCIWHRGSKRLRYGGAVRVNL